MENRKTDLTCVIINLNGERFLKNLMKTVKSAIAYSKLKSWEVILVDNGSNDGSLRIFSEEVGIDTHYNMILNGRNLGWSSAVNAGLRAARGEIVVVLSNDLEIEENSIDSVIRTFYNRSDVGIIQFNSLCIYDRTTQDSGRNYLDRFGFIYGFESHKTIDVVSFAEGVAFALHSKILDAVGYFDEDFFMMYDDADYSWRTQLMGFKVVLCPDAIVFHYRGGTINSDDITKIKSRYLTYATRNQIRSLIKNEEIGSLMISVPFSCFIKFLEAVYLFFFVGSDKGISVLKGLVIAFNNIGYLLTKRSEIQGRRKLTDKQVFRYFHVLNLHLMIVQSILSAEFSRKKVYEAHREATLVGKVD